MRLISFGSSNTYGFGLEDCTELEHSPSKLAWPSILAQEIGKECVNLGILGGSNKRILLDILNYEFQNNDIVVVLWTRYHRALLLDDKGDPINIYVSDTNKEKEKLIKRYYELHNDFDLLNDTVLNIHHASSYLKSIGVRNFHFYFDHTLDNFIKTKNKLPINAEFTEQMQVDVGSDGVHPGPKSHRNMAGHLFNIIREKSSNNE